MKKRISRVLAFFLALLLMVNICPLSVFAEGEQLTATVSSASVSVGATFDVNVSLKNNPGISAFKILLEYDETILTLNSVTYNTAMGGTPVSPQKLQSPVTLFWYSGLTDVNYNGTFATLSFTVSDTLTQNTTTTISATFDADDITNTNSDTVPMTVESGMVSVLLVKPGDINGDGKTNNKDLVCFAQYMANWDVAVNEAALDTNGDGKINNKDLVLLAQYLADWDVEIFPKAVEPTVCSHTLSHVDALAATCVSEGNTEYWKCTKCGRYYSDSAASTEIAQSGTVLPVDPNNHVHVEIIPAKAPTTTATGNKEGWRCNDCGVQELEIIPMLQGNSYAITYRIAGNDTYLAGLTINNPNPDYYVEGVGVQTLYELEVPGYIFEGWYDGQGSSANRVTSISTTATGNKILYAHWSTTTYLIQFDCGDAPLVTVNPIEYDTSRGATLPTPKLSNYVFVGWTDADGNLIREIKAGTTGNITLYANWSSYRNRAKPFNYANSENDPIILEDPYDGYILFAYEIGIIENVPLYQIGDTMNAVAGMTQTTTKETTQSISDTYAKNITEAVSKATTDSAAWTLSSNWNQISSVDETSAEQNGQTIEEAETLAKTSSNTYSINSSVGGSNSTTDTAGYSYGIGGEDTHSSSSTHQEEKGKNNKINVAAEEKASFKVLGKGVDVKLNQEYEHSWSNKKTDTNTSTDGWKNTVNDNWSGSSVSSSSKTWNSSSGYSSSNSVSQSTTTSKAVSQLISNTKHYGESYSVGESSSENQGFSHTDSSSSSWSDTFTYNTTTITTEAKTVSLSGEVEGYYRTVCAGTVHVYAVVGYDIANNDYFVYTYNVLDDNTYLFVDYSKNTPNFNDNENGVLTFEVPYFVNEYVDSKTMMTDGLVISSSGIVTGYTGNSPIVVIPTYYSFDNQDGTGTAVKITGISSNAFQGNTNIVGVCFGDFITSIPEGAFKGCTSLKAINAPGVTTIGKEAFGGCTSLENFGISTSITDIGELAFNNVNSITVRASKYSIANAAINSGAKNIVLNTSEVTDMPAGTTLTVPAGTVSFELQGGRKNYTNLRVDSNADVTVINGVNFVDCNRTPLQVSSSILTLNQVNISTTGYGLVLTESGTAVNLYGDSYISTSGNNAILCRGFNLSIDQQAIANGVSSSLTVVGDILVCGVISGETLMSNPRYHIISISEEEFELYLNGLFTIRFDPNGGTLAEGEATKTAYLGMAIGTLPTPTREHYVFNGWYTKLNGGEQVTADQIIGNNSLEDVYLYAHWTGNQHTVTFDPNRPENAGVPVISETSRIVYYDSVIGTLPSADLDYHYFDGWYTEKTGGTKVTDTTLVTTDADYTLYAHWTPGDVHNWTLASEVPSDAQIVDEKWTYTLTSTTESTSSSLSGWTQTGSYWKQTGTGSRNYASFPSGFDTSNSIYTSFAKSAYSASESESTKRTVSNAWAGYVYWHWMYDCGNSNGTSTRAILDYKGTGPDTGFAYKYFGAFTSTKGDYSHDKYYCNSRNITNYIVPERTAYSQCQGATRWFRFDYYKSTYIDYQKIYQYLKVENLESATAVTESSTISNVKHWVRYRDRVNANELDPEPMDVEGMPVQEPEATEVNDTEPVTNIPEETVPEEVVPVEEESSITSEEAVESEVVEEESAESTEEENTVAPEAESEAETQPEGAEATTEESDTEIVTEGE